MPPLSKRSSLLPKLPGTGSVPLLVTSPNIVIYKLWSLEKSRPSLSLDFRICKMGSLYLLQRLKHGAECSVHISAGAAQGEAPTAPNPFLRHGGCPHVRFPGACICISESLGRGPEGPMLLNYQAGSCICDPCSCCCLTTEEPQSLLQVVFTRCSYSPSSWVPGN